jgi:hypothetical protein
MVYLHVTFTVDAHQIESYETTFRDEFMPLLDEHGFEAIGIWKTLIGRAGEYIEIWSFADAADYERKWMAMSSDPRVVAVLQKTGPLVRNEEFKLLRAAYELAV